MPLLRLLPHSWRPTRREFRQTAALALPIVTVQLGMMLMGLVDTLMVGRLSAVDLAAVALGNLYFFGITSFGLGLLMALDPLVAQAVGARDEPGIARSVQRGLLVAALVAIPLTLLLLPVRTVLSLLGQPAEVLPLSAGYILASVPGVLPLMLFLALRQSLQALGRIAPILAVVAAANLLNALLNWMLVYGRLGAPAMGAVGTGWASSAARLAMAAGLLAVGWRWLGGYLRPWRPESFARAPLLRVMRLGIPVGVMTQLEFTAFGLTGLLMGWFGPVQLAGHQIALNLASFTFMVPLGVAASGSVLVGHAVGRGDMPGARRESGAALALGVGFMLLTSLTFLTLARPLGSLFTTDAGVLALVVVLLPIAGVFQVFDGIQVVSAGLLRGLGDTRVPMFGNIVGFWIIGIPLGWWLAFRTPLGPPGLWWGMVVGLTLVGSILLARTSLLLRRGVARVRVDDDHADPMLISPMAPS